MGLVVALVAICVNLTRTEKPRLSSDPADKTSETAIAPDDLLAAYKGPPETTRIETEALEGKYLEFRVVDSSSLPIPDARLSMCRNSEWSSLGTTNEDGSLRWSQQLDGRSQASVIAQANGFANTTASINPGADGVVQIVMEEGGSISGKVTLVSGAAPPESLRVFAIPVHETIDSDAALAVGNGYPAAHCTSTANDGSFVIEGLSYSKKYRLEAAGKGYLMLRFRGHPEDPTRSIVPEPVYPDASNCSLFVGVFHGAVLDLFDTAGNPIASPREITREVVIGVPSQQGFHEATGPMLRLAGIGEHLIPANNRRFFFYVLDESVRRKLTVSIAVPGFDARRLSVDLEPVNDGIKIQSATLQQQAMGFGTIAVRFSNEFATPTPVTTGLENGSGRLHFEENEGTKIDVSVDVTQGLVLDGIPVGSYSVDFIPHHRWVRIKEQVVVAANETSSITVPIPQLAAIECSVEDITGEPRSGIMTFEIRNPKGRPHTFVFYDTPYTFALLPPGDYEVRSLPNILIEERHASPWCSVFASAGETALVTVLAPE